MVVFQASNVGGDVILFPLFGWDVRDATPDDLCASTGTRRSNITNGLRRMPLADTDILDGRILKPPSVPMTPIVFRRHFRRIIDDKIHELVSSFSASRLLYRLVGHGDRLNFEQRLG